MEMHPSPANEGQLELSARQAAVTVRTCIVDAHGVHLASRPSVAVKQILTGGVSHASAGLSAEPRRGLQYERSGGCAGPLGSGLSGLQPGRKTATFGCDHIDPVFQDRQQRRLCN
jgi:hypothetical protein